MAGIVLIKAQVTIATVDYSAQITEANLAINGDKVEVTNFLSVGSRAVTGYVS